MTSQSVTDDSVIFLFFVEKVNQKSKELSMFRCSFKKFLLERTLCIERVYQKTEVLLERIFNPSPIGGY